MNTIRRANNLGNCLKFWQRRLKHSYKTERRSQSNFQELFKAVFAAEIEICGETREERLILHEAVTLRDKSVLSTEFMFEKGSRRFRRATYGNSESCRHVALKEQFRKSTESWEVRTLIYSTGGPLSTPWNPLTVPSTVSEGPYGSNMRGWIFSRRYVRRKVKRRGAFFEAWKSSARSDKPGTVSITAYRCSKMSMLVYVFHQFSR